MHARTMDSETVTEHYVSQINRALDNGRDDLVNDLAVQYAIETARSTPLQAPRKRAERHRR